MSRKSRETKEETDGDQQDDVDHTQDDNDDGDQETMSRKSRETKEETDGHQQDDMDHTEDDNDDKDQEKETNVLDYTARTNAAIRARLRKRKHPKSSNHVKDAAGVNDVNEATDAHEEDQNNIKRLCASTEADVPDVKVAIADAGPVKVAIVDAGPVESKCGEPVAAIPCSAASNAQPILRCPVTQKPLDNTALVLADGYIYDPVFLRGWMGANPTAILSPMAIPIQNRIYCEVLGDFPTDTKCPLTKEEIRCPVFLFPRDGANFVGWKMHCYSRVPCYERDELLRNVTSTWTTYESKGLHKFGFDFDDQNLHRNLDDLLMLVPNRLLWKNSPIVLPCLPVRPPPPQFDEEKLNQEPLFESLMVLERELPLEKLIRPTREEKNGSVDVKVWEALNVKDSVFAFHGKDHKFVNCLFTRVIFRDICWCNIMFTACRFQECIWLNCIPATMNQCNMLNNCFSSCLIIGDSENTTIQRQLVGVQSSPVREIKATAELALHVRRPVLQTIQRKKNLVAS